MATSQPNMGLPASLAFGLETEASFANRLGSNTHIGAHGMATSPLAGYAMNENFATCQRVMGIWWTSTAFPSVLRFGHLQRYWDETLGQTF